MRKFLIEGADGHTFEVPPGDWYRSTKARPQRLMRNSLSSEARRVYACLELATIGFSREIALIGNRPLTRADIAKQTGLSEAHVRRALIELEEAGLAERRGVDDGPLHKGRVEIYSWATPRSPKEKKREPRAAPFPDWFPPEWAPLESLIKRLKLSVSIESADSLLPEGTEIAEALQKAEERAKEFLARICARQNLPEDPAGNPVSAPPEKPQANGVSALQNGVSAPKNGVSAPPKNVRIRERTERTIKQQQQEPAESALPPEDLVVVSQKLNTLGTITEPAAKKFLDNCQKASPGCTASDVTAVIDRIAPTLGREIRNPIGVLIKAVPQAIAEYRKEKPTHQARQPACHICSEPLNGASIQGAHFSCYNAKGASG